MTDEHSPFLWNLKHSYIDIYIVKGHFMNHNNVNFDGAD